MLRVDRVKRQLQSGKRKEEKIRRLTSAGPWTKLRRKGQTLSTTLLTSAVMACGACGGYRFDPIRRLS